MGSRSPGGQNDSVVCIHVFGVLFSANLMNDLRSAGPRSFTRLEILSYAYFSGLEFCF